MDAVWRDIVLESLTRGVGQNRGAVAGAKLRQLIEAAAKDRGLLFPPEGSEQEKFADFLKPNRTVSAQLEILLSRN